MSKKRPTGWPEAPEALPASIVDNHTHLDGVLEMGAAMGHPVTLADQLALAAGVGVTRMVHVACSIDAFDWALATLAADAAADRVLLGAVAIHPNEAVLHAKVLEHAPDGLDPALEDRHAPSLDEAMAAMEQAARSSDRIRAIGETGLDYFRAGERGRAVQLEAFRAHIALAKDLDLPLQIHDRDAHDDVITTLLRDGAPARTVFHCFSGDAAMAARCVEQGWYLSFAGPVTFRPNDALRAAVRLVPSSLLQVETDAPYLTPDPLRGRANAPYLLPHTLTRIAAERGESVADVCAATTAVAEKLYGPW